LFEEQTLIIAKPVCVTKKEVISNLFLITKHQSQTAQQGLGVPSGQQLRQ
jgi:hypothetical protein